MESIKDVLSESTDFYRFQVFQGTAGENGKIEKTKTVGMAYLKSGQNIYTLRLWTFIGERFYLVSRRHEPEKFYVMTRELNRKPDSKNKYFWNIVGNAAADTQAGVVAISFDLFEKPIYMNLFPEKYAHSATLPETMALDPAA